ncbi:MAG: hypothetical protein JJE52_09770 [Acidimicrobiia bacterium]|nr:hypothetical protein [Acidimicrobiia bacterium]
MSILSTGAPRRVTVPQPQREGERPPLRLVEPEVRPRRVRVGVVGTVGLAAVFVGLFALAAMHSLVVQAQFALDRVEEQVAERHSEIEQRRVQVAQLEAPSAVVDAARGLGMVPPPDRIFLLPSREASGSTPEQDQRVGTSTEAAPDVESASGATEAP